MERRAGQVLPDGFVAIKVPFNLAARAPENPFFERADFAQFVIGTVDVVPVQVALAAGATELIWSPLGDAIERELESFAAATRLVPALAS